MSAVAALSVVTNRIALHWIRDERDTSSIRAKVARVEAFELIAFHLATPGNSPVIGWELFTGPQCATRLAGGPAATFDQAKRDAEAAYSGFR